MEDLRTQQIEALQAAIPYCDKIIKAIGNIIEEFSGNRQEDTDEYMHSIINGLNWIFEVYNGTQDLINDQGAVIDKNAVNEAVVALNAANGNNDDAARAEAFKEIRSFVEQFRAEAEKKAAD